MRPHILFRYSGIILLFNSGFLLLSSAVSLYYNDTALLPLLYSSLIAGLLGIFPILFVPPATDISNNEGFTIVVANWLVSCLIAQVCQKSQIGGYFGPKINLSTDISS